MTENYTRLDAREYGLNRRFRLEMNSKGQIYIVMNRSSRIIMKDAKNILEKADRIKKVDAEAGIILKTNAPICSKSVKYLKEHGINIENI